MHYQISSGCYFFRCIRNICGAMALAALFAAIAAPLSGQSVVGTITKKDMVPTAVKVYEAGDKVCVADKTTGNLYIYNGNTLAELGFVGLGFTTFVQDMVINETYGKLYACPDWDEGKIAVVDIVNHTFVRHIELPNIPRTWSMIAQDDNLDKVYVLYNGGFFQIDVATDTVTSVDGVAGNPNRRMAVNPVSHEVFISNWMYSELDVIDGITLAHSQVSDMQGLGVGVNWLENKVYVMWGEPSLPQGYWCKVIDRDTDDVTELPGDNDPTYIYLNPTNNRLYTSSELMYKICITDGNTDATVELPFYGTHLFAIRYATDHVYYVKMDGLTVLDGATEMLEEIPIATNPGGAIVYQGVSINQTTGRVYAITHGDGNNSVTVVQDVEKLNRPPVYVSGLGCGDIKRMDPVTETWGESELVTAPGWAQYGLALRGGGGRLYVPTINDYSEPYDQSLRVLAGSYVNALIATIGTGGTGPAAVAAKPDGKRVYITNSSSNDVAVIDPESKSLVTNIPVGLQPWGIAITPDGGTLVAANKIGNSASIISTTSNTVLKTIAVGTNPWGVAVNPSGKKAYVANSGSGTVSVIDISSQAVIDTVTVGDEPHWLAFSPDGKYVYVSNSTSVSVIDAGTDEVSQTVDIPVNPDPLMDCRAEGIAAFPDGNKVYVAENNQLALPSYTYRIHVIHTADYSVTPITIEAVIHNPMAVAVPDPNSKFAGRITASGAPVNGALVRALQGGVEKGTATTNASGDYAVFNLKAGTYDVEVSAMGYTSQTVSGQSVEAGYIKLVSIDLMGSGMQKDDLLGTWDGQGVYFRNSETKKWVKLASPADLITAGDLEGDGKADLVGIWPTQGGVWVRSSFTGAWTKLSTTARHIASGDMNGDDREDLLGTWDGQGVFYKDSISGAWIKMASPATLITAGDLDADSTDDLIGVWPTQGGVWVKYSKTGTWAKLSSSAADIASGDMNGDGRKDLVGTWDGQGVYYRNSMGGAWVKMSIPGEQVTTGDLDGDGKDDLIGLWTSQGGIWVKNSKTGTWSKLSSPAKDISAGKMAGGIWGASRFGFIELLGPFGGNLEGPPGLSGYNDLSNESPGGWRFAAQEEKNLMPQEPGKGRVIPGPGEPGFRCVEQRNIVPQGQEKAAREKRERAEERGRKKIN